MMPKAIPEPQAVQTDQLPLKFSFKHLDLQNVKFHCSKCSVEYFQRLFEILQRLSVWKVEDFVDENNDEHRHRIYFPATSEPNGFQSIPNVDSDQFGYEDGWQFGVYPILRWNRWRVHGILIADTFFVVWLDPEHLLFPTAPAIAGN